MIAAAPALAQDVAKPAPKPKASPAAQAAKDGDDSKKKDVSAALKAYDAGARAFEAGKLDQAVQSLTTALSNGGLPSQQMAKALYYRGAAHRKQGKPAQAISDLTTAVWLKNGLSEADRALAIDQRQAAYREAGLGDAPPVAQQRSDAPAQAASSSGSPSAPPPPVVTPGAQVSVPGSSSMFSWLDVGNFGLGGSAAPPAPTPPPAPAAAPAPAPVAQAAAAPAVAGPAVGGETATSSWSTTAAAQSEPAIAPVATVPLQPAPQPSFISPAPSAVAEATPAAAPRQETPQQAALSDGGETGAVAGPNTLEKAGAAITGFFGNMFTGSGPSGAEATNTSSSPVMTSSTDDKPAAPAPGAAVDWGATTGVAAHSPAVVPQSPAAVAPAPATPSHAKGTYRLQVAAVRSRDEANEVATRIQREGAAALGGRLATVDEAVIGNMGTFYRVRLGPYADSAEPEHLCGALRPKGYDCLVVAQ